MKVQRNMKKRGSTATVTDGVISIASDLMRRVKGGKKSPPSLRSMSAKKKVWFDSKDALGGEKKRRVTSRKKKGRDQELGAVPLLDSLDDLEQRCNRDRNHQHYTRKKDPSRTA